MSDRAKRRAERQRAAESAEAAPAAPASAAPADPAEMSAKQLASLVVEQRAGLDAEIEAAKTAVKETYARRRPSEAERAALVRPVQEQRERLAVLERELETRPALRYVPDGQSRRQVPAPVEEPPRPPRPERGDWKAVFPPLPDLDGVPREELARLRAAHVDVLRRLSEDAGELTVEQLKVEVAIGQWEIKHLADWLSGRGKQEAEQERRRAFRRIRDIAIAAGRGRPVGEDGFEEFTEEEVEVLKAIERRRKQPPNPKSLSVVAATAHWFASNGWTDFLAGHETAEPLLTPHDLGVLIYALRLIGEADEPEIAWEDATGLGAGNRIRVDGGNAVLERLARNGPFLTYRVEGGKHWIGYGSFTRQVARKAGVRLPSTEPKVAA